MRIHDEPIPEAEFAACLRRLPEACVEVLLEHDGGVLVARRTNHPARGEWFWPGSRLYKGETLEAAARRVALEELGVEVVVEGLFGVYAHFWERSAVEGVDERHTVNVVYRARPADAGFEVRLDDQHDAYRFVSGPEPGFHEYVVEYLVDAGFDGS